MSGIKFEFGSAEKKGGIPEPSLIHGTHVLAQQAAHALHLDQHGPSKPISFEGGHGKAPSVVGAKSPALTGKSPVGHGPSPLSLVDKGIHDDAHFVEHVGHAVVDPVVKVAKQHAHDADLPAALVKQGINEDLHTLQKFGDAVIHAPQKIGEAVSHMLHLDQHGKPHAGHSHAGHSHGHHGHK
eukprot:tig00000865_g5111.t1